MTEGQRLVLFWVLLIIAPVVAFIAAGLVAEIETDLFWFGLGGGFITCIGVAFYVRAGREKK